MPELEIFITAFFNRKLIVRRFTTAVAMNIYRESDNRIVNMGLQLDWLNCLRFCQSKRAVSCLAFAISLLNRLTEINAKIKRFLVRIDKSVTTVTGL